VASIWSVQQKAGEARNRWRQGASLCTKKLGPACSTKIMARPMRQAQPNWGRSRYHPKIAPHLIVKGCAFLLATCPKDI
jgi:hypothetical protein